MSYSSRRILYIDLAQKSYDITSHSGLHPYLGGLGTGLKIAQEQSDSPLIFSIGPLNGFFPFVSKTCLLDFREGFRRAYIGGSLSARLRFSGYDAVVFTGVFDTPCSLVISADGVRFLGSVEEAVDLSLPGKSSRLVPKDGAFLLDDYFSAPDKFLDTSLSFRNIEGLAINATLSTQVKDFSRYENLYQEILSRFEKMQVLPGDNPSCVNCSLGCSSSKIGEESGNILVHCLVACEHASEIYSDLGVVFSCLNALGYGYTHEDLEKVPALVKDLLDSVGGTL
jgi:hypothetical protein